MLQSCESMGKCRRSIGQEAVTVSRIERRMSPEFEIRRNSFDVVAVWKYDVFSFTKNVSGTHIVFRNSEPT
jgi:hypothetical protein